MLGELFVVVAATFFRMAFGIGARTPVAAAVFCAIVFGSCCFAHKLYFSTKWRLLIVIYIKWLLRFAYEPAKGIQLLDTLNVTLLWVEGQQELGVMIGRKGGKLALPGGFITHG